MLEEGGREMVSVGLKGSDDDDGDNNDDDDDDDGGGVEGDFVGGGDNQ